MLIPEGIYSSELSGKEEGAYRQSARKLASRMHLVKKDELRIITKSGIDITYKIPEFPAETSDKLHKTVKVQSRDFKILKECYVVNFNENHFERKHALLD